jgi:hypothetical protein
MTDDLATLISAGHRLRTRDRREVTVTAVDAATGRISGTVPMVGLCHWRRDGRYEDAPGGGAGPLDLVPPQARAPEGPQHASLKDNLDDPAARNACCD